MNDVPFSNLPPPNSSLSQAVGTQGAGTAAGLQAAATATQDCRACGLPNLTKVEHTVLKTRKLDQMAL